MIEFLGNVLVIPDSRGGQKTKILGPYGDTDVIVLARRLTIAFYKRYGPKFIPKQTFVIAPDHYSWAVNTLKNYSEYFHFNQTPPLRLWGRDLVKGSYDMVVDVSFVVDFR